MPGLRRLRLSSILPAYFSDELIETIAGEPRVCRHLHVPLQSGSDRVLRAMRRPYNRQLYRRLVERLASALPGFGLGTDVITGFPGETAEEFEETAAFLDDLPFSYLHVFSYSDRRGTEEGIAEGLAHESAIHCDEVVSLPKSALTDYVGSLSPQKVAALNRALRVALDLPD